MTKVTKVINIKDRQNTADEVYIGRGGKFGNPFALKKGEPRGATLDRYRAYLIDRLDSDPEFYKAVKALKGKTLVCFCKPFPCHGDILKEFTEKM